MSPDHVIKNSTKNLAQKFIKKSRLVHIGYICSCWKNEYTAEPLTLQIPNTAVGSAFQSANGRIYELCCQPLAYMIELSSSQVGINWLILGKLVILQKSQRFNLWPGKE
jgi:hypothetical protein